MILTYVWRLQAIFPVLAVLQVTTLASLAAYWLYLFDRDPRRRIANLANPVGLLFAALVVVMVLSIPGSLWPWGSFGFLFPHLIKTILFALLVAASIRAFADVKRLVGVHVFGASVYALMVVVNAGPRSTDRATGFGGYDPNDYAMLLACALPMGAYFLTRGGSRITRGLAVVASLLLVMAIVLSGSRGGFLAFVAVTGYLILAYSALPKRVRIGAGVLVFLAGGLAANSQYWERMATLLEPTADYNWAGGSSTGRMAVWKRGVGYMLQRPFLGVGIGAFKMAEGRLSEEAKQRNRAGLGWKWSSPHNSFVQIGAELGLIGLAVFVALFAFSFRTLLSIARAPPQTPIKGVRVKALAQALIGSLIGYIVAGLFLSHGYAPVLYLLLALVAGLAKAYSFHYERRPATRLRPVRVRAGAFFSSSPRATRRSRRYQPHSLN